MQLVKRYGPWFLAVVVLSMPIWLSPKGVRLKPDQGIDDISQILMVLVFISLLLERTLEVFVSTWRNPDASLKRAIVEELEERRAALEERRSTAANQTALSQLIQEQRKVEADLIVYKSTTHRIALWTALILGLLVSAVGIRTLDHLVMIEGLALTSTQEIAFRLTDVLITGGLLGGGSEGIHRVVKVFTNAMDTAADRAKKKPSSPGRS